MRATISLAHKAARKKLQDDVDSYLANGGKIKECRPEDNQVSCGAIFADTVNLDIKRKRGTRKGADVQRKLP